MKKCVTINILNYTCLPNNLYHNVFRLREDHTGISLNDDLEIHVMELTKLEEKTIPLTGGLINWLLFLKGVEQPNWEVLAVNEPMLKKAMDTLEFLSQDAATRMEYETRMKYLRDEASRMNGAKAEGIAEGEHKKAVDVAKSMLRIGIELKIIAQVSGLSEQEILELKLH